MKYLLIIIFSTLCNIAHCQEPKKFGSTPCMVNWKYFEIKKLLLGKVLLHEKAYGPCGYFAFASCTIIKTTNQDTVRILELCNENKIFMPGDSVIIKYYKAPPFGGTTTLNNFDCSIKNTAFGIIAKMK
jgi:hypothetical protein